MRVPAWIQASPGADVGESCVRNTLARIGFAPKWMASSYADRENPNPRRSDRTMGRAQGRGEYRFGYLAHRRRCLLLTDGEVACIRSA